MNARPEAWIRQANHELAFARLAKDYGFMAQACYHASQAAEKALKGALLELGIEPPHTPVLNDLVQLLENEGLKVATLNALPLRGLSRIAIQSRYPVDTTPPADLFDLADAEQAIKTAEAVLDVVAGFDAYVFEGFQAITSAKRSCTPRRSTGESEPSEPKTKRWSSVNNLKRTTHGMCNPADLRSSMGLSDDQ